MLEYGHKDYLRHMLKHRTGIGKTRSMIEMLHDSYSWQVAKVVIMPKMPAVNK